MNEEDETLKMLESMQQEIAYLRGRVNALEAERRMETPHGLPETWLLSPNLLKRAFGVYGHNWLASLLISIPFICLYVLLFLLLGVMSSGIN
jgi:hypothetical protein